MAEKRYDVIFKGELAPGFDLEKVKMNLVKGLSVSEEKAVRILSRSRVVLRRGLDQEGAKQYCMALKKIGMVVYVSVARPERVSPPMPLADKVLGPERMAKEAVLPVGKPEGREMDRSTAAGEEGIERPGERVPFEFKGKGSEYFRIWMVNILLSIITLGIYSAWAKVRRKQYFYGSTLLQGAGFEYLADPVKILKGRLMVVGFFILYNLVSRFLPLVGAALSLTFLIVLPWLVVRSLAFNAYNSSLRNIRFRFNGTYGEAAEAFLLWPFLAVFTLGVLFPYAYFKQKKFIVEHTSYGTTRFSFKAKPSDYYRIGFSVMLFLVGGAVIVALFGPLFPPLAALAGLVLYLYVFAFVAVKTSNLLFNSTRIRWHKLEGTMEVKGYSMVVLTNTIATALTMGMFYPWARVRATRYKVGHLALIPSGDLDSFVAAEEKEVSALGDEISDFLDFDFGL